MNTPAKLGLYALALAGVLGGGLSLGAAAGPSSDPGDDTAHEGTQGVAADDQVEAMVDTLPGLSISAGGTTLVPETATLAAGRAQPLRFTIVDDTGAPVTAFDVSHDRELHLLVISRDLTAYAHLHPTRDAVGTWTAEVPALTAGAYRVFADFTASGREPVTLGADLAVPGDFAPAALPPARTTAEIDGYKVELAGTPAAGEEATVELTVTRDGRAVTDLEPYLGSLGHLVTVRHGDLAYLHVHPLDEGAGAGGPTVRFGVDVPTAGTYRMFFDFAHEGTVRTAAFTVDVPPGTAAGDRVGPGDHGHEDG